MVTADDEGSPARPYICVMKPLRFDALLALAFLVEAELEVLFVMQGDYVLIAAGIQGVLAVALAVRRLSPRWSLSLGLRAYVAFQPLGHGVNDDIVSAFFVVLFLLFSFGLEEKESRAVVAGMAYAFVPNGVAI